MEDLEQTMVSVFTTRDQWNIDESGNWSVRKIP